MKSIAVGILLLAGVAAMSFPAAAATKQCMVDDGGGRMRPCSALYKQQNPGWASGKECMVDEGGGRLRPCSALVKPKH
jgi:hypothetical protein